MTQLLIGLIDEKTDFQHGGPIEGAVAWQSENDLKSVSLRLFWYTEGKGDRDVEIVEEVEFDGPFDSREKRAFQFTAPAQPSSYEGRLISIKWALELVAEPCDDTAREEIVISPTGSAITASHDSSF